MSDVSGTHPDWSREHVVPGEWSPSKFLLATIRDYQRFSGGNVLMRTLGRSWTVLRHRFWSAVTGADIPLNCQISGGLLLPHPNGVVIHRAARIGPNCLIFQQVTIGSRGEAGVPDIGGHVDIGAGAKLLGSIRIGNDVVIGANAVVFVDVPDGHMAVGVPAVVKPRKAGAALG